MILKNRTYNVLRDTAQIYLPGLGALYSVLSPLWNLPNPEAVVGTVVGIDTFLGLILKSAQVKYAATDNSDGIAVISTNPDGKKLFTMEFDSDEQAEGLLDGTKKSLTFKVEQRDIP